jgi:hypothetical protein
MTLRARRSRPGRRGARRTGMLAVIRRRPREDTSRSPTNPRAEPGVRISLPLARNPAFLRTLHPWSQPICTPIMLSFAPLWQHAKGYGCKVTLFKVVLRPGLSGWPWSVGDRRADIEPRCSSDSFRWRYAMDHVRNARSARRVCRPVISAVVQDASAPICCVSKYGEFARIGFFV